MTYDKGIYIYIWSYFSVSGTELKHSVLNDEGDTGVFCCVNEVAFQPHLRMRTGCQKDPHMWLGD